MVKNYDYEIIADMENSLVPIGNKIPLRDEWSKKQKQMAQLNNTAIEVFPGVARMVFWNYVLFAPRMKGDVYWFNTNEYYEEYEDKKLTLIGLGNLFKNQVAYENGVFYPSKGEFLLKGYSRSGGRQSIKLSNEAEGHFIPRVHQIIAMLGYGEIALYALGEGRSLVPNHIDGLPENNGLGNINITTISGNRKHYLKYIRPKYQAKPKNQGKPKYQRKHTYVELFKKKWAEACEEPE